MSGYCYVKIDEWFYHSPVKGITISWRNGSASRAATGYIEDESGASCSARK